MIPGAEITRSKPLGHLNALFVQDVNLMEKENPVESIAEAKGKGHLLCGIIPAGRIIRPLYIPYMKTDSREHDRWYRSHVLQGLLPDCIRMVFRF